MSIIEKKLTQAEIFCQNYEPELAISILNEVITDSNSTDSEIAEALNLKGIREFPKNCVTAYNPLTGE